MKLVLLVLLLFIPLVTIAVQSNTTRMPIKGIFLSGAYVSPDVNDEGAPFVLELYGKNCRLIAESNGANINIGRAFIKITKEVCMQLEGDFTERDVDGWVYSDNMDFGVTGDIFINKKIIDYANEMGRYSLYFKQEILKELKPLVLIGRGTGVNAVYH